MESKVRCYCRSFPTVFTRAKGSYIEDESGRRYLDFFSGAGALNYGHNNPFLRRSLFNYLQEEGITHSLDMATHAKKEFLERFEKVILKPRGFEYRVQFTGPTGTNAIEAALKIARKVTGRKNIVAFTKAFHGVTLGSLAATSNPKKRRGAGVPLSHCIRVPFCEAGDAWQNKTDELEALFVQSYGTGELPAAVLIETVQAEGGVNVANFQWLEKLVALCRRFNVLFIVDDIQAGCGRTGSFFSFDPLKITPDLVCLSKSLSGYGLPMAIVLIRPEFDQWEPGEHDGTFRGNNLAFVTASAALRYWVGDRFTRSVQEKAHLVRTELEKFTADHAEVVSKIKGRGLIQGIAFRDPHMAIHVSRHAFRRGLIIETSGHEDEVLKLLPPLTIRNADLEHGIDIISQSIVAAISTFHTGRVPKCDF